MMPEFVMGNVWYVVTAITPKSIRYHCMATDSTDSYGFAPVPYTTTHTTFNSLVSAGVIRVFGDMSIERR